MVAISRIINNGLLLTSPLVFLDVDTPEQASLDSYNLARFLGGAGPYVQHPGYGISTEVPPQCTLEQVHLLHRHGERYPTNDTGASYEAIMEKVQAYNKTFAGDLAFLNSYTYFVQDKNNYEKETTPLNSEGPYTGTTSVWRQGVEFRNKYRSLFNETLELLKVFSSNSGRCHLSGKYFARGFLGDDYSDSTVDYYILNEDGIMGANSLTPAYGCTNFNESGYTDTINLYNTSVFTAPARERLLKGNTGLNLTEDDVLSMFSWCAYEINVRGSSPFCSLFTNDEFVRYSYYVDVLSYYSDSYGNNMSATTSAPMLNATLKFLLEENPDYKIVLAFTHDNNIENFHSALGLFQPDADLPTSYVPFPSPYAHVQVTPQSANTIAEKYKCGEKHYVRYLVNGAVIPIKSCQSGPGFSCELSDFATYVDSRLNGKDYRSQCGIPSDVPSELTFLWDYTTKNYTVALIDG